MLDKEIILVGYSGHGFVVAETAIAMELKLKYFSEKTDKSFNPFYLKYLGYEGNSFFKGWRTDCYFILGIGDNKIRQKVAQLIKTKNKIVKNVIHPTASIARKVILGEGNFIARNVSVNPITTIGSYCILNTACVVEHECVISDAVHIAPGAVLAGKVTVGERAFIGANSFVKQGVKIGSDVIIGAGAVVIEDIPDGKKIVGNPAREI